MYMLVYVHLTFETVPQLEWTDMSNKLEASNGTSEPWEVILNSWGYLASLKMFVFRQFSSEKHPSVISPYFSSQKCHKYNFRICLNSELGFFSDSEISRISFARIGRSYGFAPSTCSRKHLYVGHLAASPAGSMELGSFEDFQLGKSRVLWK
jgi:hypothetical protein